MATASDASVARVWPGSVVVLADATGATGYRAAIGRAVRAWNEANVGVRFAVRGRQSRAEVRVVVRSGRCIGGRAGSATGGFVPDGARVVLRLCPPVMRPLLVAHELGRVLGLPVDDGGCSLMNSSGLSDGGRVALPGRCSPWAPPSWLPGLIDPASIAEARRLYTSPGGPREVSVRATPAPRVSWRLPKATGAEWTEVARGVGHCPSELELAEARVPVIYRKRAFAGLHWVVDRTLAAAPASYCYGVFDLSRSGRATRRPGFVSFVVDEPPTAALSFSPPQPVAGQAVVFTDESVDPDGTITHWHWDFGDSASAAADVLDTADPSVGRQPQHVYATAGTYTVNLTVTDSGGEQATSSASVTVH